MALQNATLSATIPSTILTQYHVSATAKVSASIVPVSPQNISKAFTSDEDPYSQDDDSAYSSVANLTWTYQDAMSFNRSQALYDLSDSDLFLWLTPTGCSVGGGLRNCSETCLQPKLIFNDTSTLANCEAMPFISQLLDIGALSDSSTAIAESYGIAANNNLASEVTMTLKNCISALCQSWSSCGQDYGISAQYKSIDGSFICDYVDSTVSGDIAGIGIYISYWLQSGITIIAWILLRFYDSWIYYLVFIFLVWPRGSPQARNTARSIHMKAKQRALPRLAAALVDFQKAQCYFMIAVQIAAMVTLLDGLLQSTNLQQLYNNWEAVRYISVSGFLPVTFNLLCLHSVGKKSSYLILLSTITVAVSAATLFRTGAFSASNKDIGHLQNQLPGSGIPECGNHDPTIYCLDPIFDNANPFLNATFAYSLTILFLLYLDMLKSRVAIFYHRCKKSWHHFRAFQIIMSRVTQAESALGRLHEWMYRRIKASKTSWNPHLPHGVLLVRSFLAACVLKILKNWQKIGLGFLWLVVWSWSLFCFFNAFANLYILLDTINFSWTFGQIVGITVWLEPCVEYAYLESQGMKAANYRFLSPWHLTRPDEDTATDGHTTLEPSQYDLKTIKNGSSIPERSSSITLSSYSVIRDEDLREDQHYADTMAQRLL